MANVPKSATLKKFRQLVNLIDKDSILKQPRRLVYFYICGERVVAWYRGRHYSWNPRFVGSNCSGVVRCNCGRVYGIMYDFTLACEVWDLR
jgi:hypothetical protein